MADVYGTNYNALVNSQIEGSDQLDRVYHKGQVHFLYDTYEAAAAAIGTVIHLGPLPKGAVVLPGSRIVHDALGASSTIKVGDNDSADEDDDRYAAAESTAAAGDIVLGQGGVIDNMPYKTSEECALVLTTAGAAITGTIKAFIAFTWG